jgi:hypothetical protein
MEHYMKNLPMFDEYGHLIPGKKQDQLRKYAGDRIFRLLRKLMRGGMGLRDAEWLLFLLSGEASSTLTNQDYMKKYRLDTRKKRKKPTKSGIEGS